MNFYQRPFLIIPLFLFAILISLYTWQPRRQLPSLTNNTKHETTVSSYLPWHQKPSKPIDTLYDVQNRTLGFQEIKVISLPERTDKHDAWAVSASVTGFDFALVDGVDSTKISDKAIPYTMDRPMKVVACWRAHMDVLQDIVNRGVASTLVFEDDADWDVSIKSQLVQFARGSRWLADGTGTSVDKTGSPYGEGWDFLWLGHCGGEPRLDDPRRFVIPNDPTVEPLNTQDADQWKHFKTWADATPPDLQTRYVAPMLSGICTAGYAISLQGAKKVLYHMSMLPFDGPVDWGFSDMCRDQKSGFSCLSPFPRIIGAHRPAGGAAKWSDIETNSNEIGEAHSEGLVFSTRMNLDRLLVGQTIMKSTISASDVTGNREMDINEVRRAVGHEEIIEIDMTG